MLAATHAHQMLVELLESGAPVDLMGDDGLTPLHRACAHAQLGCATELVARKADILAISKQGWTPVLYAAVGGHAGIVQMLLEASMQLPHDFRSKDGISTNLLQHRTPQRRDGNDTGMEGITAGMTPLLLAAKYGHASVVCMALR